MDTFRKEYRPLTSQEKAQMDEVKNRAEGLLELLSSINGGREIALAKTKLEEAVMWAVKSITG